jgi:hypothetical protein
MRVLDVLVVVAGTSAAGSVRFDRPALNPWMVPIKVYHHGKSLGDISVDFCEIDWTAYRKNPTAYPLNQDVIKASKCSFHANVANVKFSVLEAEYNARCKSSGSGAPSSLLCEPAGIIQHEARVGSTLAANMMAVVPTNLVYPESTVPHDLLAEELSFSHSDYSHAIRVIFAAFARPAVAAAAGDLSPRFPELSNENSPNRFRPDRFFLKLQVSLCIAAQATLPCLFHC